MTRRQALFSFSLLTVSTSLVRADPDDEKYTGPRPPKKDVPYLLHARNLVETEHADASQSESKGNVTFSVSGAASPVRTPLAEPIFLIATDKLSPDSLALYRFDVKNGRREIAVNGKKRRNRDEPAYRLSVKKLEPGLVRLESATYLENGEYSLSPEGENIAFCFSVF